MRNAKGYICTCKHTRAVALCILCHSLTTVCCSCSMHIASENGDVKQLIAHVDHSKLLVSVKPDNNFEVFRCPVKQLRARCKTHHCSIFMFRKHPQLLAFNHLAMAAVSSLFQICYCRLKLELLDNRCFDVYYIQKMSTFDVVSSDRRS